MMLIFRGIIMNYPQKIGKLSYFRVVNHYYYIYIILYNIFQLLCLQIHNQIEAAVSFVHMVSWDSTLIGAPGIMGVLL